MLRIISVQNSNAMESAKKKKQTHTVKWLIASKVQALKQLNSIQYKGV